MAVASWVSVLIVLAIVVAIVVSIAVALATSSKGSRPLMWGLLGTLFAVLAVGGAVLLLKPSRATLSITGATGIAFSGTVTVDGVEQRIDGVVPAEFEFVGRRIEYAVIPQEFHLARYLGVELRGNGTRSPYGAQGTVLAMPGGLQHASHAMSEDEWEQLSDQLRGDLGEPVSEPSQEVESPAAP